MLKNSTTQAVTAALSELFLFTGLCSRIASDNGGCFRAAFGEFCKNNGIIHVTSSPYHHAQVAESGVYNAKQLARKTSTYADFQEALAAFRSAPKAHGYSATDLFFGRSLKTNLPPSPLHNINF